MPAEAYDQAFFEQQSGGSLKSARIILGEVLPVLQPRRVLDIGCGVGTWLRAALDLGVPEVLGIDGDYVDQTALQIDARQFIAADLASIAIPAALGTGGSRFDLVICMEVAEHLPHQRSRSLIEEIVALSDVVLFSAAVPFQFGEHHVNEQWPEFWALLFRERGFICFDCVRDRVWSNPAVEWWYAQNTFVFAREGSDAAVRLPTAGRAEGGLARVHPQNFLVNLLSLPRRYRQQAAAEEFADFQALQVAYANHKSPPALAAVRRAQAAAPDTHDVFPWTRTEVYSPEQEIADVGQHLLNAERSYNHARAHIAAIETSRLLLEQKLGEARDRIADLFGRVDRLEGERAYWEGQFRELEQRAVPVPEPVIEAPPLLEVKLARTILTAAGRIPQPVRRAIRRSAGIVYRLSHGSQTGPPVAVAAPALEEPTVEVLPEAVPAAPPLGDVPLRRWQESYGSVSAETLAQGVARLRRFELFDAENYLGRNSDVGEAGLDPYRHFLQAGAFEDRGRIDPEELARAAGSFMLLRDGEKPAPAELSVLPELVQQIPHIGIYVSSFGNLFMEDIAGDLARDLRSVGLRADVLDETSPIEGRPPLCLFVAPHEFFTLGGGRRWARDDILSHAFMFGTEQVQTKWFNLALPFILMSRGILDICAQTAMLFGQAGMPALHVLPGCRLHEPALTQSDRQHPLFRVLPPAAQAEPEPGSAFKSRPLDVNFFGNGSPRRNSFFARNAAFFSEYETFLYCRNAERGPLLGRGQESALTRLAAHVSGHSKITLNIHRDDMGFFEWHRMVRLGMCSGSVVVSDPCLPHPDFVAGKHYFQEQARHVPDLLEYLLRTEDGAREAERVRANVDDLMSNVFDTRRTMTELLSFFVRHADGS